MRKQIDQFVLDPKKNEREEDLSFARLKSFFGEDLRAESKVDDSDRPQSSLIDLMKWSKRKFESFLSDKKNLNIFINNKIAIDGEFLCYCDNNKVSVKTLYKDSIVSWRTNNDYERFFCQGIFLVKSKDVEFLVGTLFHKGHENEDEISFFVIVSEANYEKYIRLRNDFEDWCQKRERDDLHIRVVDGNDIPYTQDHSWEDLFLPNDLKQDIKDTVEIFLSSKDFYEQHNLPWKRGVLLYGEPGCHIKGTPIMMSDGSWKNVEDVEVGDFLMGPDSEPREVIKLVRGKENMYKISPKSGKSFTVNENHILHLQHSASSEICPKVCNITVKDYLSLPKRLQENLKLVRSPLLKFNSDKFDNSETYEIDPYALGVWLVNGTIGTYEFASVDSEIEKGERKNSLTQNLKKLGILDNKLIPQKYLTADTDTRLKLLAGIIDANGSYEGCFDFAQKDPSLSEQIKFLCNSLGFGYNLKTIKSNNSSEEYHKISLSDNIFNVPTKLHRKRARRCNVNKNHRMVGIDFVEPVGVDDFYGFTVDKDHLYIMDDFWITHNCGKTSIIRTIISNYNFKPVTIVPSPEPSTLRDAFSYAEEQGPSLLYFEDLDSLLQKVDVSEFLNLMDGISAKNGLLVIATANDISKFKTNITDRPSRFDRKIQIPTPDTTMAISYMKKMFGTSITMDKIRHLAKVAASHSFSYAYIKELYISSMFEAISNNRTKPTEKDIYNALDKVMKDKNIIKSGKVTMSKYFSK